MKTIHTLEYKKLLAWLRNGREEKGLTMRTVGQALKISHSWVGKVEIGERRLDVVEYVKLCRVLEINPHEGMSMLEKSIRPTGKPAAKLTKKGKSVSK